MFIVCCVARSEGSYQVFIIIIIIIIIINIQHAPLRGNTTCFWVKYSQYGYIYLQFMYIL